MADIYITSTIPTFEHGTALQTYLDKWPLTLKPPEDADENYVPVVMTPQNATIKEMIDRATETGVNRAGPYKYFEHIDAQVPNFKSGTPNRVVIPINNMRITTMYPEIEALAIAEGRNLNSVVMAHDDFLYYKRTGIIE